MSPTNFKAAFQSLCVGVALFAAAATLRGADLPAKVDKTAVAETSTNVEASLPASSFITMETLDNAYHLARGDRLSFRILEDQIDPKETLDPKPLMVADSGEVEVPYIGRFPGAGKTCRQLASEIKTQLEKDYYYQATVIIAVDSRAKSTGKVYLAGQVRATGPIDIPGDEVLTLSKAIGRAGGFTEYADKRHVKVTRKDGDANRSVIVDVSDIMEKGKADKDVTLETGDAVFVPSRLFTF